jgi:hypothetical protein
VCEREREREREREYVYIHTYIASFSNWSGTGIACRFS